MQGKGIDFMRQDIYSKERFLRLERNHIVSAGAGSGKTSALVELYVNLIERGVGAKEILAITFTEKAASELKERIEKEIQKRIINKESERRLWAKALRDVSSASIGTFHNICALILKGHAVEAGTAPDFKIIDEYDASRLLNDAVRNTIVECVNRDDESAVHWVKSINFRNIIDAVSNIYQNMRNHGCRINDLQKSLGEDCIRIDFKKRLDALIKEIDDNLISIAANNNIKGEKTKEWSKRFIGGWQDLKRKVLNLNIEDKIDVVSFTEHFLSALPKRASSEIKGSIDIIKEIIQDIKSTCLSFHTIPHIQYLINLIKAVDANYSKAKAGLAGLDFQDLLNIARDLLIKNKGVRRFYKEIYKKVLVDEFQDTNRVQAEIVYCLAEMDDFLEDMPFINTLAPQKLAIVGDMKQSIYGFRGADVSVFEDVIRNFDENGVLYLNNNRRSSKSIVSFVNEMFIESGFGLMPFAFNKNALQVHTRKEEEDFLDEARVEFLLFKNRGTADDKRILEADTIAKRIKAIAGRLDVFKDKKVKAGFGDIAILFRTLKGVEIYEDALKRHNIPYYLVKGGGFYHRQEILDICNVLHHIESGWSDIHLAGVLRSPFAELMDETLCRLVAGGEGQWARRLSEGFYNENVFKDYPDKEVKKIILARNWFKKWKGIKDRLAIAELIETVLADTNYLASVVSTFQGEQKVANVKKLIEAARRFEREGNVTIRDFANYLKSLIDEPPRKEEAQITTEGMDVVKIMTIHQAKGLEFPVVFVPDIGRGIQPNKDRIIFSPTYGIAARHIDITDFSDEGTSIFNNARDNMKERDLEEHLRIFYVACTRARDYLILSGESSGKGKNWRDWLDSVFGKDIERFIETDEPAIDIRVREARIKLKRGDMLSDAEPVIEKRSRINISRKSAATVVRDVFDFKSPLPNEIVIPATILASFMTLSERSDQEYTHRRETSSEKAMGIGSFVHMVMERLDYNLAERDAGYVSMLVNDAAKGCPISRRDIDMITSDIKRYVLSDIFKEMQNAKNLYREVPFFVPIKDNDFTIYIKGVIDLLYQDKDGIWHIIDYKYSKDVEFQYINQMKIYSHAISKCFGCIAESKIVFMKGGMNILNIERFDVEGFTKEMLTAGKNFCSKPFACLL